MTDPVPTLTTIQRLALLALAASQGPGARPPRVAPRTIGALRRRLLITPVRRLGHARERDGGLRWALTDAGATVAAHYGAPVAALPVPAAPIAPVVAAPETVGERLSALGDRLVEAAADLMAALDDRGRDEWTITGSFHTDHGFRFLIMGADGCACQTPTITAACNGSPGWGVVAENDAGRVSITHLDPVTAIQRAYDALATLTAE
jgi:hypothetical protein